jgi:hypothetical protein
MYLPVAIERALGRAHSLFGDEVPDDVVIELVSAVYASSGAVPACDTSRRSKS